MDTSQSILHHGKAAKWRVQLAEKSLEFISNGYIYQQSGIGLETYVIHSCRNMGEPLDSARHRAAQNVFDSVMDMGAAPKNAAERMDAIARLRVIWKNSE